MTDATASYTGEATATSYTGELSWADKTGHSILRWDQADPDSVKDAKRMFDDLLKKGYRAFEFSPVAQGKGAQIRSFDPALNEIVMMPPVVGG